MFIIQANSADVTIYVRLRDSTTGLAKTGLVFNSAGASCYYTRPRATATVITLATLAAANSAHSDGGFKEVDATNAKGLYRLDLPDAVVATGAGFVVISIEFDGIIEESVLVNLSPPVDAVAFSGDTTAADNAELMFDGTGYAGGTIKLGVDAVAISGDTTAADNAESFFDGTGYAGTGNVIPTVTNVTTVNGLAADVITATSIASNAITSAKIATGALTSTAFAAGAIASGVIASAELNNIADALLKRDWTAVTGEAARSVMNALRFLRNRRSISGTTLTVYEEDDAATAWTGTVTRGTGNPVTEVDPA